MEEKKIYVLLNHETPQVIYGNNREIANSSLEFLSFSGPSERTQGLLQEQRGALAQRCGPLLPIQLRQLFMC